MPAVLRNLFLLLFLLGPAVRGLCQEQEKDKAAPLPPPPKSLKEKKPVNDSLYLKKGQVYISGLASLSNSSSKPRGGSGYPPQSSFAFALEPSIGVLLSGGVSAGLAAEFFLQNQDNSLPPIYPPGSRLRQKTSLYTLHPNIGLYQAALNRLYVHERLSIGPRVGNITATLTDSVGRTLEERSFSLRGTVVSGAVGFLYFIRREIALDALLTYNLALERIKAYNQPTGTLDVWLPSGRYTTSGIRLQVGIGIFIR